MLEHVLEHEKRELEKQKKTREDLAYSEKLMNQEEKRKQIELQQKIMWEFNFYFQKNILDQRLLLVNIKNYHLLLITIKNYYLLHNLWRSVTEIFGSGQFFKIKFRRVFWYCELYTRNKANFSHEIKRTLHTKVLCELQTRFLGRTLHAFFC